MKTGHLLLAESDHRHSKKLALLLFVVAFVCFIAAGSPVFGQGDDMCQTTRKHIAELEKQAETLQAELGYDSRTEDSARNILSNLNKAITDPQRSEPGHLAQVLIGTSPERYEAAKRMALPWKEEYLTDDLLFLKSLREKQIPRVTRIHYVMDHKLEIEQEKAHVNTEIAAERNRLVSLRCSGYETEGNMAGFWTAIMPNPSENCTLRFTLILTHAGANAWKGPLKMGGDCKGQVQEMGNVNLVVTGPGTFGGDYSGKPIKAFFTNTQIVFPILGVDLTFNKK